MNRFLLSLTITTLTAAAVSAQVNDPPESNAKLPKAAHRRAEQNLFDETYQFLFFATLEGLYRDGVADADVEALLARKGKDGGHLNFIYTCPICMPVEGAIETYKLRPSIDHLKIVNHQTSQRTFGERGLPQEISAALRSENASIRLKAVNELVSGWMAYRLAHSGKTNGQKKALVEELKKRRQQGMDALRRFASNANGPESMAAFAAGYEGNDECAICNAALQMPIKLKSP